MKILWVKTDFLHPTDRGGQIRTLETLRRLHRAHEIHYVAYDNPAQPEGVQRASEYATRAYPVNRPIPRRNSPAFFGQLARNLFSPLPLAVGRYASSEMRAQIARLIATHTFDSIVCDFVSVAPNIPGLSRAVLFQHNVETMIWRRHAEHARDPFRRAYFQLQAKRMFNYERHACRSAAHVIAVSRNDADQMRRLFGITNVSEIATGVDLDFFRRPDPAPASTNDLVFVGAMDWLPNIDGVRYFTSQVLPIIRRSRPQTSLVLAGRSPVPEIRALAETDPLIRVTGTVPDIRPYLWNSTVSIVPLRIGGGTRLKIYEAMAAGVPVVATSIGAEGLAVEDGQHIHLANDPESFAARCLALLEDRSLNRSLSTAALELVSAKFSWEQVAVRFETILESACSGCPGR
jgi:glycosyltransferase involved in cell wall biosynthesis